VSEAGWLGRECANTDRSRRDAPIVRVHGQCLRQCDPTCDSTCARTCKTSTAASAQLCYRVEKNMDAVVLRRNCVLATMDSECRKATRRASSYSALPSPMSVPGSAKARCAWQPAQHLMALSIPWPRNVQTVGWASASYRRSVFAAGNAACSIRRLANTRVDLHRSGRAGD